jgi:hypothetical protein
MPGAESNVFNRNFAVLAFLQHLSGERRLLLRQTEQPAHPHAR